jgi:hypothetical protein
MELNSSKHNIPNLNKIKTSSRQCAQWHKNLVQFPCSNIRGNESGESANNATSDGAKVIVYYSPPPAPNGSSRSPDFLDVIGLSNL